MNSIITVSLPGRSIKARVVHFTYGTAKDAALYVAAEACSINTVCRLLRRSYLEWMFGHAAIMSDECVLSSIGKFNYFEGALGGYEQRLDAETFALVKEYANNDVALACDIVRFRPGNAGISQAEIYRQASFNRSLSEEDRAILRDLSKMSA